MEKFFFLSELPNGWVRETDPQGKVIYFNKVIHRASHTHPCLYTFRALFNQMMLHSPDKSRPKIVVDKVTK